MLDFWIVRGRETTQIETIAIMEYLIAAGVSVIGNLDKTINLTDKKSSLIGVSAFFWYYSKFDGGKWYVSTECRINLYPEEGNEITNMIANFTMNKYL